MYFFGIDIPLVEIIFIISIFNAIVLIVSYFMLKRVTNVQEEVIDLSDKISNMEDTELSIVKGLNKVNKKSSFQEQSKTISAPTQEEKKELQVQDIGSEEKPQETSPKEEPTDHKSDEIEVTDIESSNESVDEKKDHNDNVTSLKEIKKDKENSEKTIEEIKSQENSPQKEIHKDEPTQIKEIGSDNTVKEETLKEEKNKPLETSTEPVSKPKEKSEKNNGIKIQEIGSDKKKEIKNNNSTSPHKTSTKVDDSDKNKKSVNEPEIKEIGSDNNKAKIKELKNAFNKPSKNTKNRKSSSEIIGQNIQANYKLKKMKQDQEVDVSEI